MMKNREKYNEFLEDCLINGRKFGIDKKTNEPHICDLSSMCSNCKFSSLKKTCSQFRKDWLEEEVDELAAFRNLKKGDIIMFNKNDCWYPVIFISLTNDKIHYATCIDKNGDFHCPNHWEDDHTKVKVVK